MSASKSLLFEYTALPALQTLSTERSRWDDPVWLSACRLIAVLPGPSAAVVPVKPEVSIELSPTGVLKCIDVRVRVAASRDHARPISTRNTIICGEMHCALRVSRLRGVASENKGGHAP